MISPDVPYRVGLRAFAYMALRKLKYPLILICVMIVFSFLMSFGGTTFALWSTGTSPILKSTAEILFAILKYGWLFAILFGLFSILIVIPEYRGLVFRVSDNAFYLRSGIISHKEIAIPYRQIQTINIIENPGASLFGLCGLTIVTSAHDDPSTQGSESEATLPLIHKSLARDLQSELLKHLDGKAA